MKKTIFTAIISCLTTIVFAQNNEIEITFNQKGIIERVKFPLKLAEGDEKTIPLTAQNFFKEYLKITSSDEFVKVNQKQRNKNFAHDHYDQYYKGIKVDEGGYNLHFEKNRLYLAHGNFIKIKSLDIKPTITKEDAKLAFANYKKIPLDVISNSRIELLIKELPQVVEQETKYNTFLVYYIYLVSGHPNNNEIGFIDARNGKVLTTEPSKTGYTATGTFATRYNGSRQSSTQYYNGVFNLCDSSRNSIIHTRNLNGSTNYVDGVELTDNDNDWTAIEYSENEDDMGLDIHWGLQQIHDYFENEYNINSFNDTVFGINAFIHYGTSTDDRDNAHWNLAANVLAFGDGAVTFSPVASLDAVAHEYGHGISDLQLGWPYTGDRAAFHEGLSDIWGVILENGISPNSIWEIGEEIILNNDCLRNIQDPNDLNARTVISDTYLGNIYNSGDQYTKSGVFSHWFYLLVNGGVGINDIGNSYAVYGIGMDAAERLIVESVFENYLNNVTTYPELSTQIIDAAESNALFGENSFPVLQVENAWYAVGIGSQPTQVTLSGSSYICTSNSTFTLENLPSGASVNWTHTNNLSYVSGQGTANYTVSAVSNSIGVPDTITATISSASCQDIIIQKEVYSSPDFSNFEIQVPASPVNGNYDFVVWASGLPAQITNYNWTVSNGYIVSQDLNEIIIHPTSCTLDPRQRPVTINVSANNTCGSTSAYTSVPVDCDGGIINPLSVQPNPANNYIDAEIINDDSEINNNELQIKLFNYRSIPVYTGNSLQKSFRINTSHLPHGLYILQVIYNGKKYSKQVLVEH